MQTYTANQANLLQDYFKNNEVDTTKMAAALREHRPNLNQEDLWRVLPVVSKIARQATESEWANFMNSQEVPVIKLSATEMEAMRGGIAPLLLYAAGAALGFTIAMVAAAAAS